MKIHIDDYIKYYDTGYKKEMFGWVKGIHLPEIYIACDDCWGGARETSCNIEEDIIEILPNKIREFK